MQGTIFVPRQKAQMGDIYACTVEANMVDRQSGRNGTEDKFPRDPMRAPSFAIRVRKSVAVSIAATGVYYARVSGHHSAANAITLSRSANRIACASLLPATAQRIGVTLSSRNPR